ncbi:hypothetical protein FPSE_06300 [Fusarium pseudograminearum CS3096]|uniref:Uncharacterized protein n=1 Tax=Fusarium pseudograminearum (strain CS3096) TaxID=1028729 RepID=K3VH25_FUSPC|nr:hypothetical protein FPSE_06300 [Fusarium pseudograminearum CS3096]EKJ73682.1 hypothetical protein FPSE_06300 [Fusarium pseudograminearum CS3096]
MPPVVVHLQSQLRPLKSTHPVSSIMHFYLMPKCNLDQNIYPGHFLQPVRLIEM